MKERFEQYISEHGLLGPGERVLLAVSGGMDSVVMAHLFRRCGFSFALAHCNFQLRGKDSEEDAAFVRALGGELGAGVYEERFDTQGYASQRGLSVQVAARELRYEWLESVRVREGFHHIATAHHLNDSLETVLYNFTRGTGLRGLTGIPLRNGAVIRPLLFATREELEDYARRRRLAFREDVSNTEEKYDRNKIRLRVLPVLREINPGIERTAAANLQRLAETLDIFEWAVGHWRAQLVWREGTRLSIDYEALRRQPFARTLLHEWLSPYGFADASWDDLLEEKPARTGAVFEAPAYLLLVDRDRLIVEPKRENEASEIFEMRSGQNAMDLPGGRFRLERRAGRPSSFPADPFTAFLDPRGLHFPLRLRHWRPGDAFQPLGMGGQSQKLQDFFSNQKIDRLTKDRIWLVEEAAGAIVWVVGHRPDERFRIREDTDGYLVLQFQKS